MFVYRKDLKNCGDYWCTPQLYFNEFKNFDSFDILNIDNNFQFQDFLILGGGGLGKKLFHNKIQLIERNKNNKKIICWGVGFNEIDYLKKKKIITEINLAKKININHFNNFDLQGIRDYQLPFDYDWVPCISCLHPFFKKFRNYNIKKKIGVYYHYKMELKISGIENENYMSNYGTDLNEKLNFLSNYEYIVTNSYHGVYWAQLLNRKVLCFPVKSSLFNFPYKPSFIKGNIDDQLLGECRNYPNFFEQCIEANLKFRQKVKDLIGF